MPSRGYYAVAVGRRTGIYDSWSQASAKVTGYSEAIHKKFSTKEEAQRFMDEHIPAPVSASNNFANTSAAAGSLDQITTILGATTIRDDGRLVYTAGVWLNGGQSNATAGMGVWWKQYESAPISELLPGSVQTAEAAELFAIHRALEMEMMQGDHLTIRTKSDYAVKCLTQWHQAWSARNWRKIDGSPVDNAALIREILALSTWRPGHVEFSKIGPTEATEQTHVEQLAVLGSTKHPAYRARQSTSNSDVGDAGTFDPDEESDSDLDDYASLVSAETSVNLSPE